MKIDLGFTPHYYGIPEISGSKKGKKEKPPTVYPSIHLEGEAAKVIGCNVETDSEVTALVTFRVVSKRESAERNEPYGGKTKEGCTVELELRSISSNKLKEPGDKEDDEDSAEKAVERFFDKK